MFQILPVKIDLFAVFILLGICQGILLSYFFLIHSAKDKWPNRYLGLLMLSFSLVIADVWLGYTNYMFYTLFLVDSSEPVNFTFAPLLFLYIKTSISRRFDKSQLLHFIPFLLYFVYMCVCFYPQPLAYKYNAYISAFHPGLAHLPHTHYLPHWVFILQRKLNDLTIIQMAIYQVYTLLLIKNEYRKNKLPFFSGTNRELNWLRNLLLHALAILVVFFIIRSSFKNDLGDHIIAAHIAYVMYVTSFAVLKQSSFIDSGEKPLRKNDKSLQITEVENQTLIKLAKVMQDEKPYLQPDFSLPALAKKIGVSTHHLSQVLNNLLHQSFFEYAAGYRIEEAKKLLENHGNHHIKIEEIAEMVGYNSKSSFNTVFKKNTGYTPSEYKSKSLAQK